MQVHRGWENLPRFDGVVLTIGTFDGVHYGHQQIVRRINDLAAARGTRSVVLTFHPHPRLVLHPGNSEMKLITTIDEKISLLERMGIDHFVICPFSEAFASIPAERYVEDVLVRHFRPSIIVIGYDHHFGKDRRGNLELLKRLAAAHHYEVEEIPKQTIDDLAVSSTKVRDALLKGDIRAANELLCHPFTIRGLVIPGERIGRKLGFPTANLEVEEAHKLIPPPGVYAIRSSIDETSFNGLLSIGYKPTFGDYPELFIEAYFLDFNGDLYGSRLELVLLGRLRGEMKFADPSQLVEQIKRDESEARRKFF